MVEEKGVWFVLYSEFGAEAEGDLELHSASPIPAEVQKRKEISSKL